MSIVKIFSSPKGILLFIVVLAAAVTVIFAYLHREGLPLSQEEISLNSLKNTDYHILSYDKNVRLEKGEFFSETGLKVSIYEDMVFFSDLNGDDKRDALVVLNVVGESGTFRELAVVLDADGPSYITSKQLGEGTVVNSLDVQNGVIIVDATVDDAEKIFEYKFVYKQLVDANTEGWLTYANDKYGFEVKYPDDFSIRPSNINGDETFVYLQQLHYIPDIHRFLEFQVVDLPCSNAAHLKKTVINRVEFFVTEGEAAGKEMDGYARSHYTKLTDSRCLEVRFKFEALKTETPPFSELFDLERDSEILNKMLSTFKITE